MQIPRKFLTAPKVDDAELNLLFYHYQLNWLLLTFYCAASCLFFLLPPRIKFGDKRLWWKNDSFSVAKKRKSEEKSFTLVEQKKRKAFWKDCGKSAGKSKNIKLNYFLFPPRTIEIESRRDWYILEVFFLDKRCVNFGEKLPRKIQQIEMWRSSLFDAGAFVCGWKLEMLVARISDGFSRFDLSELDENPKRKHSRLRFIVEDFHRAHLRHCSRFIVVHFPCLSLRLSNNETCGKMVIKWSNLAKPLS